MNSNNNTSQQLEKRIQRYLERVLQTYFEITQSFIQYDHALYKFFFALSFFQMLSLYFIPERQFLSELFNQTAFTQLRNILIKIFNPQLFALQLFNKDYYDIMHNRQSFLGHQQLNEKEQTQTVIDSNQQYFSQTNPTATLIIFLAFLPFFLILLNVILILVISSNPGKDSKGTTSTLGQINNQKKTLKQRCKDNTLLCLSCQFVAWFSQIFNWILLIPSLQLSMFLVDSFTNGYESGSESLRNLLRDAGLSASIPLNIFTIIASIVVILYSWILVNYGEQSLQIYETGLLRIYNSGSYKLSITLKMVSVLLFYAKKQQTNVEQEKIVSFTLQALSVGFFLVIQQYDFYSNNPYSSLNKIFYYQVFWSWSISLLLLGLLGPGLADAISDETQLYLTLIIALLLQKIISQLWSQYCIKILTNSHQYITIKHSDDQQQQEEENDQIKQYRIAQLLMQKSLFLNEQPFKFILFSIFQYHVDLCTRKNCFCKKVDLLKSIQQSQGMQLNEEFYEKYLRLLALNYKKGVRDLLEFSNQVAYLHLICFLNDMNLCTKAFHQIYAIAGQIDLFRDEEMEEYNQAKQRHQSGHSNNLKNNGKNNEDKDFVNTVMNSTQKQLSQHVDIFTRSALKYLVIQTREGMQKLMTMKEANENFVKAVDLFLAIEDECDNLKDDIYMCLLNKQNFLIQLFENKYMLADDLFQDCTKLTKKMRYVEYRLNILCNQFTSQRTRSLTIFFLCEVLNKYVSAGQLNQSYSASDEKIRHLCEHSLINLMQTQQQTQGQDSQQQNVVYAVVGFGKEHGKILKFSSSFPNFFGYQTRDFTSFIKNTDKLIPLTVSKHHPALVENFFFSGQSRYFKSIDIAYGLEQQGYIFPMYMYFDLNMLTDSDFAFTLFLRKCEIEKQEQIVIICDNSGRIGGVTRNLWTHLVFDKLQQKYFKTEVQRLTTQKFNNFHNNHNQNSSAHHSQAQSQQPEFPYMSLNNMKIDIFLPDIWDLHKEDKDKNLRNNKHVDVKFFFSKDLKFFQEQKVKTIVNQLSQDASLSKSMQSFYTQKYKTYRSFCSKSSQSNVSRASYFNRVLSKLNMLYSLNLTINRRKYMMQGNVEVVYYILEIDQLKFQFENTQMLMEGSLYDDGGISSFEEEEEEKRQQQLAAAHKPISIEDIVIGESKSPNLQQVNGSYISQSFGQQARDENILSSLHNEPSNIQKNIEAIEVVQASGYFQQNQPESQISIKVPNNRSSSELVVDKKQLLYSSTAGGTKIIVENREFQKSSTTQDQLLKQRSNVSSQQLPVSNSMISINNSPQENAGDQPQGRQNKEKKLSQFQKQAVNLTQDLTPPNKSIASSSNINKTKETQKQKTLNIPTQQQGDYKKRKSTQLQQLEEHFTLQQQLSQQAKLSQQIKQKKSVKLGKLPSSINYTNIDNQANQQIVKSDINPQFHSQILADDHGITKSQNILLDPQSSRQNLNSPSAVNGLEQSLIENNTKQQQNNVDAEIIKPQEVDINQRDEEGDIIESSSSVDEDSKIHHKEDDEKSKIANAQNSKSRKKQSEYNRNVSIEEVLIKAHDFKMTNQQSRMSTLIKLKKKNGKSIAAVAAMAAMVAHGAPGKQESVSSNITDRHSILNTNSRFNENFCSLRQLPQSFNIIKWLRFLEFLLLIILSTIFLLLVQSNIKVFTEEYNVLEVADVFIEPINSQISIYYQAKQYYKQSNDYQNEYKPYLKYLEDIGQNLTNNLINQSFNLLSNGALFEFWGDDYIDLYTPLYNQSIVKLTNISIFYVFHLFVYELIQMNQWNLSDLPFFQQGQYISKANSTDDYNYDDDIITILISNQQEISKYLLKLKQEIYENSVEKANSYSNNIQELFIPFIVVFVIVTAIQFHFFSKYIAVKELILNFFNFSDKIWLETDIERYQALTKLLENNIDSIFHYQIDQKQREKYLELLEQDRENILVRYKQEKKSIFLHLPPITLNRLKPLSLLVILFMVILAYMLSVLILNINFANNFIPSVQIYSNYSRALTLGTELLAIKDILYARSSQTDLLYIDDINQKQMSDNFHATIEIMKNFINTDMAKVEQVSLLSQKFIDYVLLLANANLCTDILQFSGDNLLICNSILGNKMQNGLASILPTLMKEINEEELSTHFQQSERQIQYPKGDQIIAATMISQVFKKAIDVLLETNTILFDNNFNYSIVLTVIFLIYLMVLNWYFLFFQKKNFEENYFDTKAIICLIPSYSSLIDRSFCRNFRGSLIKNKLIED